MDGCFWHRCRVDGTVPKHNLVGRTLDSNVERNRATDREFEAAGWAIARLWEDERADEAAARIEHL